MKATITKKGITVTGIMHEGMLEDVQLMSDKAGCKRESKDFHTKMVITGNQKQLDKFVKLWNKE
jgi:hypothetical protein